MTRPAPLLVLAIGNPSRGDDALGPALAERLEALAPPGVDVLVDFQLQVEHCLDLVGRERVIFVDAGARTPAPYELRAPRATDRLAHTSHALEPEAVLAAYRRVHGSEPPPALVLCVRGESFELGAPLSVAAATHLDAAWQALQALCRAAVLPADSRPAQPVATIPSA
jgi:hydrogenase maturation protease